MYKQPPIQYRFKKGASGNPAGRPKSINLRSVELIEQFFQVFLLSMKKDMIAKDKIDRIVKILKE